jgi:hypothetical protein
MATLPTSTLLEASLPVVAGARFQDVPVTGALSQAEFWDFFASPKELPVLRTREGFNKGRECTERQERRDCLRNACAAGRIL